MKYANKEYCAPRTDIFQLGSNERLMQDVPMAGSPTHGEVGEGGEGFFP